jgi:hypothetical protein
MGGGIMSPTNTTPLFNLGDRVRIVTAPGFELFARVREVFGPIGAKGQHMYRVSLEAAMGKPVYATYPEDFLEMAPRRAR